MASDTKTASSSGAEKQESPRYAFQTNERPTEEVEGSPYRELHPVLSASIIYIMASSQKKPRTAERLKRCRIFTDMEPAFTN